MEPSRRTSGDPRAVFAAFLSTYALGLAPPWPEASPPLLGRALGSSPKASFRSAFAGPFGPRVLFRTAVPAGATPPGFAPRLPRGQGSGGPQGPDPFDFQRSLFSGRLRRFAVPPRRPFPPPSRRPFAARLKKPACPVPTAPFRREKSPGAPPLGAASGAADRRPGRPADQIGPDTFCGRTRPGKPSAAAPRGAARQGRKTSPAAIFSGRPAYYL